LNIPNLLRWLLVACVFCPATALPAANWLRLDSPHFEMLTDADEAAARSHLVELEQFRSVFLQFMGEEPEIGMKVTVVLFASEAGFERFKPIYRGGAKSVAGFFVGSGINGFMALARGSSLSETKRVIYHEYVHALYHELGWRPPLWLNEGTAEVFSTYRIRRGQAELGLASPYHVELLRHTQLMPVGDLLQVGHDSPAYNETSRQGLFYAQSWALAHYLVCNSDSSWRARLNAFLPRLTEGPVSEEEFRAGLGIGYAEMTQALDRYIYGGAYQIFRFPVPEKEISSRITVRRPEPAERDVTLQLLEAFSRDSAAAEYQLLTLAEKHPESPVFYEAIASLAVRQWNTERAQDYMRRAVERNTTNTRVYWLLGEDLRRRWLVSGLGPNKRLGAVATGELRATFGRVVRDQPGAIDAWEALARTEAFAPEPERATLDRIRALAAQHPADPRVLQALMLAGFGYKRLGDSDLARDIARQVDAAEATRPGTRQFNRVLLGDLLPAAEADKS
jgi:hypothetical protein